MIEDFNKIISQFRSGHNNVLLRITQNAIAPAHTNAKEFTLLIFYTIVNLIFAVQIC